MKLVRDVMSTDCAWANPSDSVFEVARQMKQQDVGMIPVLDHRKMIGVVTDRDLTVRGYAENKDGSVSITEVMSREVRSVTPDVSIEEAAKVMAMEQVRRLPVVDNDQLVGIVALADLAVREQLDQQASEALSGISEPTKR